jgi:hypothetical protein
MPFSEIIRRRRSGFGIAETNTTGVVAEIACRAEGGLLLCESGTLRGRRRRRGRFTGGGSGGADTETWDGYASAGEII